MYSIIMRYWPFVTNEVRIFFSVSHKKSVSFNFPTNEIIIILYTFFCKYLQSPFFFFSFFDILCWIIDLSHFWSLSQLWTFLRKKVIFNVRKFFVRIIFNSRKVIYSIYIRYIIINTFVVVIFFFLTIAKITHNHLKTKSF